MSLSSSWIRANSTARDQNLLHFEATHPILAFLSWSQFSSYTEHLMFCTPRCTQLCVLEYWFQRITSRDFFAPKLLVGFWKWESGAGDNKMSEVRICLSAALLTGNGHSLEVYPVRWASPICSALLIPSGPEMVSTLQLIPLEYQPLPVLFINNFIGYATYTIQSTHVKCTCQRSLVYL